MARLQLSAREISDLEMIATGGFSPLKGFMGQADYLSVWNRMGLRNGLAWAIPVTLSVPGERAAQLKEGQDIALYQDHHLLGVLHLAEKYTYSKQVEAETVYRTADPAHPGVKALF